MPRGKSSESSASSGTPLKKDERGAGNFLMTKIATFIADFTVI